MKYALIAALLLTGCVKSARLYEVDSTTPTILVAHFKAFSSRGPAWIGASRKTATCQGEYSTVAAGTMSWGNIFATNGAGRFGMSGSTESAQRGVAVMTCGDGMVIECEYVASGESGSGHGACRDSRDRHYRLMF